MEGVFIETLSEPERLFVVMKELRISPYSSA
jgi:hypothetical protein